MDKKTASNIYYQELERFEYQYQWGIIDMHTYDREMRDLEEWYRAKMRRSDEDEK